MDEPMKWTERELAEHTAWMRRLARGLTRDDARADDLVQDAWLKTLEGRGGPDAKGAAAAAIQRPAGWFKKLLSNRHATDQRTRGRRADRERRAARRDEQPPADEALRRIELQQQLARAVFSLDEPYQRVVGLRFFEGWPPRKIAAELDLDVRTVEARLRRGLEALRRKLDAENGGRREEWFSGIAALGAGGGVGWKPLVAAGLLLIAGTAVSVQAAQGERPDEPPAAVEDAAAWVAPQGDGGPGDEGGAAPGPVEVMTARAVAPAGRTEGIVTLLRAGDEEPLAGAVVTGRDAGGRERSWTAGESGVVALPRGGANSFTVESTDFTRIFEFDLGRDDSMVVRVPRRGGTLEGLVVDLDGAFVPHAQVRLFTDFGVGGSVRWDAPTLVTEANSSGHFSISDLASERGRPQDYRVLAVAPGYLSVVSLSGRLGKGVETAVLVVGPSGELAGHVSAWDQAHVEGAPIWAYLKDDDVDKRVREVSKNAMRKPWGRVDRYPSFTFTSDAQGRFVQPMPLGDWRVDLNHTDYRAWSAWTEDGQPLDIFLESGAEVEGRVLGADGQPVPDALVRLTSLEKRAPVQTDASGRFRFEELSDKDGAVLCVTADGHACSVQSVDITSGTNHLEVRLEPEFVIQGQLVDPEGIPVPNVQIRVVGDRTFGSEWMPRSRDLHWEDLTGKSRSNWTDTEGRFEVRGLYPGKFHVRTGPLDTTDTFAQVPADGEPFVVVQGERAGSVDVSGRLNLPGGAIAEHGRVELRFHVEGEEQPSPRRGVVDVTDGHFELTGLEPGLWRLSASTASHVYEGEIEFLGPGEHHFAPVLVTLEQWRAAQR